MREAAAGARGILAGIGRLDAVLDVLLVGLVVLCAWRYVDRHGADGTGLVVLGGAVVLASSAWLRRLLPRRGAWPTAWVVGAVAVWGTLTLAAPSFAWCAVPLVFGILRVIPFGAAVPVVGLMVAVVVIAQWRLSGALDPTAIAGLASIAVVGLLAFRALARESAARRAVIDELERAHGELLAAQRRAGALAERARLSRDIHDSVGQQLMSINLLLRAVERDLADGPAAPRERVELASSTARAGLEEVRRVVRDLAPAELDEGADAPVRAALAALVEETARANPSLAIALRADGAEGGVPPAVAAAILRTARGALANAVEHSGASRVNVSFAADERELRLDVGDDGRGMPAGASGASAGGAPVSAATSAATSAARERRAAGRGTGLRGIRARTVELGGRVEIESAPGEGTVVSLVFSRADFPRADGSRRV